MLGATPFASRAAPGRPRPDRTPDGHQQMTIEARNGSGQRRDWFRHEPQDVVDGRLEGIVLKERHSRYREWHARRMDEGQGSCLV